MTDEADNLAQVMKVLDEPGSVPYTLRPDDIQACRDILRRLLADDQITGGYAIGNVQAYTSKAQVMIEFVKPCGALASGEIAARTADSSARLGTLCRKVIAHYDTNNERMQRLEEFLVVWDEFDANDWGPGPDANKTQAQSDRLVRLHQAREALG